MNTGIALVDIMPLWFWIVTISLFGLAIGSFLNVVIYRLPLEQSIVTPRSACPNCGHQITAWENIPVLSYMLLGGKCRGCRVKISIVYPFVEVLTASCFLLAFFKHLSKPIFNLPELITDVVFIAAIITLIFIDYYHMILPDEITKTGAVLAVIVRIFIPTNVPAETSFYALQFCIVVLVFTLLFFSLNEWKGKSSYRLPLLVIALAICLTTILAFGMLVWGLISMNTPEWYFGFQTGFMQLWRTYQTDHPRYLSLFNGTMGIVLGAGLLLMMREGYFAWRDIEGMGLGDVKMMLMVGMYLGWRWTVGTLVLSCFLGVLVAIPFFIRNSKEALQMKIPFGVFLGAVAILMVLYGDEYGPQFLNWYVRQLQGSLGD